MASEKPYRLVRSYLDREHRDKDRDHQQQARNIGRKTENAGDGPERLGRRRHKYLVEPAFLDNPHGYVLKEPSTPTPVEWNGNPEDVATFTPFADPGALGAVLGSPACALRALFLALMVSAVWALGAAGLAARRHGARGPFARYAAMWAEFAATGTFRYRRPARTEALAVRIPLAPALALGGAGALLLPF